MSYKLCGKKPGYSQSVLVFCLIQYKMWKSKTIPNDDVFKNKFIKKIGKIDFKKDTCTEWGYAINRSGYGTFRYGGQRYYVHRVSFSIFKNRLTDGLVVDHICNNRKCFNPLHLNETTIYENAKRGLKQCNCLTSHNRSIPTLLFAGVCKNGHVINDFTELRPYWDGPIRYQCKKCVYEAKRRQLEREYASRRI